RPVEVVRRRWGQRACQAGRRQSAQSRIDENRAISAGGGNEYPDRAEGPRTAATTHFQCRRAPVSLTGATTETQQNWGILQVPAQRRGSRRGPGIRSARYFLSSGSSFSNLSLNFLQLLGPMSFPLSHARKVVGL